LALTSEAFGRFAVPSSAWLATVLALPFVTSAPEVAAAAIEGESLALVVPAEQPPDHAPALQLSADGRVTGKVPRVLGADRAVRFVVCAENAGSRELRLVESVSDGVLVTPQQLLDRSRTVADVEFAGAVSASLRGDPVELLATAAARAAVLVAADSLGASSRMLDLAVEYSLQRQQFGVPIGSFQAVKHAAATVLVGVEAARSIVYFAAASVDARDDEHALHAAAAKAQVTGEGVKAADSALTMHGAIGFTWEHDLHFFYKRAKLDQPLFGEPSLWNERIASGLNLY
jgi:alkylation response protein AidB-like acyl-CoA dehydrogenase